MNQLMQTDPLEFGAIAAAIGALIFAAAFGLAWVWGRSRLREQAAAHIRELEVAAGGHQDIEAELRRQSAELRSERDVLQEKLSEEQQRRVSAETIALKARENLDEQKKLFEQARAQLTEAFQSIASDALGQESRNNFWSLQIRSLKHSAATRSAISNCANWRLRDSSRRSKTRWANSMKGSHKSSLHAAKPTASFARNCRCSHKPARSCGSKPAHCRTLCASRRSAAVGVNSPSAARSNWRA